MSSQVVERKSRAQELRRDGYTLQQIAEKLGVSSSSVSQYLDPRHAEKTRLRRARYRGVCIDCGAATDGSNGRGKAPKRCSACAAAYEHETRYWTPERITEGIQRFARENGRAPFATEGLYNRPPWFPHPKCAIREFGSWATAIEAAGFPRPRIGGYERTPATLAKMRQPRIPTETYIRRLRALSSGGWAPPNSDDCRPAKAIAQTLRKRGISWPEACAMAGLRPRLVRGVVDRVLA